MAKYKNVLLAKPPRDWLSTAQSKWVSRSIEKLKLHCQVSPVTAQIERFEIPSASISDIDVGSGL